MSASCCIEDFDGRYKHLRTQTHTLRFHRLTFIYIIRPFDINAFFYLVHLFETIIAEHCILEVDGGKDLHIDYSSLFVILFLRFPVLLLINNFLQSFDDIIHAVWLFYCGNRRVEIMQRCWL